MLLEGAPGVTKRLARLGKHNLPVVSCVLLGSALLLLYLLKPGQFGLVSLSKNAYKQS